MTSERRAIAFTVVFPCVSIHICQRPVSAYLTLLLTPLHLHLSRSLPTHSAPSRSQHLLLPTGSEIRFRPLFTLLHTPLHIHPTAFLHTALQHFSTVHVPWMLSL